MSDIQRDLGALVGARPRPSGTLDPIAAATPIPAQVGVGRQPLAGGGAAAGGAGAAFPLTEENAATRTYHAAQLVTSTDGLVTFEVTPVASITMKDANGQEAKLFFANPPAP